MASLMALEGELSLPAVKRLKSSSSYVVDCAYAIGVAVASAATKAIALNVEKIMFCGFGYNNKL